MWDLPDNPGSIALVEAFVRDGKPVAAVCHGPAALTNVRRPDGAYLVAGKNVTGFANSEEDAVGLSNVVPFLLETGFESAAETTARPATSRPTCWSTARWSPGRTRRPLYRPLTN
jgi:putative intracellular protease/amidase